MQFGDGYYTRLEFERKNCSTKFKNIDYLPTFMPRNKKKSIAVPLHAMEAHGGRGGIAPTHS
jgi:hypothetical protein